MLNKTGRRAEGREGISRIGVGEFPTGEAPGNGSESRSAPSDLTAVIHGTRWIAYKVELRVPHRQRTPGTERSLS
jgi:hypothetical protein